MTVGVLFFRAYSDAKVSSATVANILSLAEHPDLSEDTIRRGASAMAHGVQRKGRGWLVG